MRNGTRSLAAARPGRLLFGTIGPRAQFQAGPHSVALSQVMGFQPT